MKVLITGSSSGIGAALALEFAQRGHELVLVARDAEALKQMAQGLPGAPHEVLVADLRDAEQLEQVCERLQSAASPIDVFVHSAGIGLPPGGYLGNPVDASIALNELSIDAQTRLTHAALPGMLERGRGGILTVGSIAGFLPGSPAITYSAAKAWAQVLSEGLHRLTRGTGVTATVVTPGFVRSRFHSRAGIGASGIHDVMWTTPELVARAAVRGFERRRALVVPGAVWKLVYAVYKIAPRSWTRAGFARYMAWTGRRSA